MERNGVRDRLPQSHAAVQYLTWALEEIEKFGHPKAALHACIALDELYGVRAKNASSVFGSGEAMRPNS